MDFTKWDEATWRVYMRQLRWQSQQPDFAPTREQLQTIIDRLTWRAKHPPGLPMFLESARKRSDMFRAWREVLDVETEIFAAAEVPRMFGVRSGRLRGWATKLRRVLSLIPTT